LGVIFRDFSKTLFVPPPGTPPGPPPPGGTPPYPPGGSFWTPPDPPREGGVVLDPPAGGGGLAGYPRRTPPWTGRSSAAPPRPPVGREAGRPGVAVRERERSENYGSDRRPASAGERDARVPSRYPPPHGRGMSAATTAIRCGGRPTLPRRCQVPVSSICISHFGNFPEMRGTRHEKFVREYDLPRPGGFLTPVSGRFRGARATWNPARQIGFRQPLVAKTALGSGGPSRVVRACTNPTV
jgi:hypothetical protein